MDQSDLPAPSLAEVPERLGTGVVDATRTPSPPLPRWFAALQVFLVCGFPTAVAVSSALYVTGSPMTADGSMLTADPSKISLEYFAMAGLFDTALVAILIRVFLAMSGETSHAVFFGRRSVIGEAARGLALVPVLVAAVVGLMYGLTRWLPFLHNVPKNPLEMYMDTPLKAGLFIIVVILAGGVREELQRGFILHRFEQGLGGIRVGLVLWSMAFALLHLPQGYDVALAVGLLGAFWGVLYIRRRSVVVAMVSHAGFDAAEVLQQLLLRTLST